MSSVVAGLAGVLLSPLFAQVLSGNFFAVLVAAIAASVFGRLSSVGLTLLGGLLLGALQGVLAGALPANSVLANGLRPALPFVALFLLLLFLPGLRRHGALVDPLAGVDSPIGLGESGNIERPRRTRTGIAVSVVLGLVAVYAIGQHYPEPVWMPWLVLGAIYTVVFLSVTVMTGMAGQVAFCLSTFAAIGAYTTAQLATSIGTPVLVGVVTGALLAAAVGAILAVPTARLSGLYLSLATLAFALFFQSVIQPLSWVTGGSGIPLQVPRPTLGPIDMTSDRSYLVLCAVVATLVALAVTAVRKGTLGQYLDALRGSSVGAQAIGIDPRRARVVAFALAAGVAGLGGGLLATYHGSARPADFDYSAGLLWVAAVVTLGSRTVEGAVNSALTVSAFGVVVLHDFLPWLLNAVSPTPDVGPISEDLVAALFGVGAIMYVRNPDGILAAGRRSSARTRRRIRTAWERRRANPQVRDLAAEARSA
jgi:ABC-type branched-subunit amino acid transport system permease subunit